MLAETVHVARSGSKTGTVTKITNNHLSVVVLAAFMAFVPASVPSAVSQQPAQTGQQPTQTPKGPVFRVGAHLVTLDAYPTQGGKIITGLTPDDFEVYEDGKLQKVEQLEYIDYGDGLPDDDRSVHLSAREGLELAANSRYRVTVFVLDRQAFDRDTWLAVRGPILQYLRKTVEPRDLIGFVTTDDPWDSMVLGRRLSSIEEEISNPDWLRPPYREDALVMAGCGMQGMLGRVHAETTFTLLEGLVRMLGQVREDHSSIVFISNGIARTPPDRRSDDSRSASLPRTSLVNGRIQRAPGADMHETYCRQERQRLKDIDFDHRFAELTKSARAANISFYPIGVWNPHPSLPPELIAAGFRWPEHPPAELVDSMLSLAKETEGFAVPPLANVGEGLRRIAADVGTHYLLGYYTNNTKWDGKIRSLRVRLKRTGAEIRARSEYRAPTAEDIAGLTAPVKAGGHVVPAPVAAALSTLSAVRPSAQFFAYGALAGRTLYVTIETPAIAVEAGRWGDGGALDVIAETAAGEAVGTAHGRLAANGRASLQVALEGSVVPTNMFIRVHSEGTSVTERVRIGVDPVALVGDPLGFRSSARGLAIPAASFVFAHDEKLRLEWPVLGAIDRFEARLLDRYGLPLKFHVAVEDQPVLGARRLVSTMSFASLGRGDYVVELVAAAGETKETHYLAIRVN